MVTRAAAVLFALMLVGCPDDFGGGAGSAEVGLVAPSGLTGSPNGGSQVILTWTDRATSEQSYRLEMNGEPFGTPTVADVRFLPADSTRYVYPTTPDQTYYFRVVAVTATMESGPSEVAVVHTPDVPVQPTGLSTTTLSSNQIQITWMDLANETGYRLQRSIDAGVSWPVLEGFMADAVTWIDTGLAGDTSYRYRLVAYNQNGESTPSDPVVGLTATASMTFSGVAASTDGGTFASCAVLPDGSEQISYYRATTEDVFFSARTGGGSFITTMADGGLFDAGGDGTSVALDGSGTAHVVAHNRSNSTLRYATNPGGFWIAAEIAGASGGARPRIACNPGDGTLHVVYQSKPVAGAAELRHAVKPPGQPWSISALPASVPPEAVHSIALDGDGVLHVLFATSNGWLYWIRRAPPALGGTTGQQILISHGPPDFTSLVIDGGGTLHGFYRGAGSKSLHHVWQTGSGTWNEEPVHDVPGVDLGAFCSAAVHRPTGRLHVAYYDALRRDLRYARKDPGGSWVLRILDVAGDVGSHSSLSVDAAGIVHVAYRDETNQMLRVAAGAP